MRARFPVTVHILFLLENRVLLLRRANTGYADGMYSLPAGHLEGGETIRAAAIREAEEEVGLQLDPQHLAFAGVLHRREGDERVDFFIHVIKWQGQPFNAEPDKCDEMCWVDVHALPDKTIPYIRQAIQNCLMGIPFDEFGWES
jgi:8-oxo-dGTP diphosphatase